MTSRSGPPTDPMLSIGAVARATGIPVETIRTWERRYGYPEATRRPSGHRLYPLSVVPRLRRIAAALVEGHRAGELLRLGEKELEALLLGAPGGARRGAEPPRNRRRRDRIAEAQSPALAEMLEAIEGFDGVRLRLALESAASVLPPLRFLEDTVAPLMDEVGRRWADRRFDVRHEHFASATAAAVLAELRRRNERPGAERHVALAMLPGDRHELGLSMASVAFAVAGWRVVYLGLETPVEQILALAREAPLDAVAIGISPTAPRSVSRELQALARKLPASTTLIVGGSGQLPRVARAVRFATLGELADWGRAQNPGAHAAS